MIMQTSTQGEAHVPIPHDKGQVYCLQALLACNLDSFCTLCPVPG